MSHAFRARTCAARTFASRTWANDQPVVPPPPPVGARSGTTILARYAQYRVVVAATPAKPVPRALDAVFRLRAKLREAQIIDLDTAVMSPPFRLGVGDVRLPIPAGTFGLISSVQVSFVGSGPGWSYELVDRDIEIGPRVRIYRNGQPLDATIDAVVRGY